MEILKVARVFMYLSTHITCSHTVLVRTTVRINRLPPPPTPTPGFQYGCCSRRGGAYWRFSLLCHFILYLPRPSISWGCHFSAEAPALNFARIENTLQWPCKFYNQHHIVCVWKYCSAIRQQASCTLSMLCLSPPLQDALLQGPNAFSPLSSLLSREKDFQGKPSSSPASSLKGPLL